PASTRSPPPVPSTTCPCCGCTVRTISWFPSTAPPPDGRRWQVAGRRRRPIPGHDTRSSTRRIGTRSWAMSSTSSARTSTLSSLSRIEPDRAGLPHSMGPSPSCPVRKETTVVEDSPSDGARPGPADKARLGLKQTVFGKAKEVAGALTGNDSLTTEGRLEQEQARQTRKADTLSHMAEAESDEAV